MQINNYTSSSYKYQNIPKAEKKGIKKFLIRIWNVLLTKKQKNYSLSLKI